MPTLRLGTLRLGTQQPVSLPLPLVPTLRVGTLRLGTLRLGTQQPVSLPLPLVPTLRVGTQQTVVAAIGIALWGVGCYNGPGTGVHRPS